MWWCAEALLSFLTSDEDVEIEEDTLLGICERLLQCRNAARDANGTLKLAGSLGWFSLGLSIETE